MVKLTKIYTRTGDAGETGLGDGSRTPKQSERVAAYGDVDEANAAVGIAIIELGRASSDDDLKAELVRVQNDLFDVGADLCVPVSDDEEEGQMLRVSAEQTKRLEHQIDDMNADLPALDSFVLPGGSPAAAALHLARTITRRAERSVSTLIALEAGRVNPECMVYLNRLSDMLFVMTRIANDHGKTDVKWVPGAHRENGTAE